MNTDQVTGNRVEIEPATGPVNLPSVAHDRALSVPATVTVPSPSKQAVFSVSTLLGVLRRRWFITGVIGIPVALAAAYAAWTLIPTPYTAFAEIRIRNHVTTAPGRNKIGPIHKELKQTHMQLVRDRRVIDAALLAKGIARLDQLKQQEDPAEWLEKNLKVTDKKTEFFRISLVGVKPRDLAKILNAIVAAYFDQVVVKDRMALEKRLSLYEKLKSNGDENLEGKRKQLRAIINASASNKTQLDEKQKSLIAYRLGLLTQIDELDVKIFKLEVLIEHRKKNTSKIDKTPISESILNDHLMADREYREAKMVVDAAEKHLSNAERDLTANHPGVTKAKASLKAANEKLKALRKTKEPRIRKKLLTGLREHDQRTTAQLQEEVDLLKSTKVALNKKLKSTDTVDQKISNATIDLEELNKGIARQQAFVESLFGIITQLRTERQFREEEPRIEIWRKAVPPTVPNRKKKFMGTAAAGVGGFGIVLLAIAFLDMRSRRINSVQQFVEQVGIPVLGTVPLIPRSASTRKNGRWAGRARYWHGVLTESVDAARTLLVRDTVGPMQVFMVASAISGEGKTTMACHLATSLARAGNHVLLVDGDLRRPFVHRTFGISAGPGLAELLRGEAELESVIQPSGIARLPVLAAGNVDQKALGLLAQGEFSKLIDNWRTKFDYIVVDSSPILPVADGLLIAQHVDGVLFTVRRDVSRVTKVIAACEKLTMLGVPLLGAVAIGLQHDGYGYTYHGYSSGDDAA